MPATKTLVICKSVHHNNTARVAHTIADVLGAIVVSPGPAHPGSDAGSAQASRGSRSGSGNAQGWVTTGDRCPPGSK